MISKRYCFKGFLQFACVDLSSCISLLLLHWLHWLHRSLIIIRSVLRAMVVGTRIDLRLGVVSVGRIRRLLLRVDCKRKPRKIRGNYNNMYMERGGEGWGKLTGHQVLQIQLLLLLTLVAQADRSAGQQNGSQQTSTDACPGHNVRPIIDDLSVVAQYLNMEEHTLVTTRCRERGREWERGRVTHRVPLLVVILANDFLLLKELDRMPKTHCASGQQTGN